MPARERWIPYLFLLPALGLLLVFNLFPTVATLNESLHANSLISGGRIFVGLENFVRIFNDPVFWKSLRVTVIFSLLVNPIQVTLALGLAVLANQQVRGIASFRSIYLLPVAVSINVTTIVWGLMLDSNSGIVNGFLALFGIPAQPFLTAPSHALWSIMILATWKGVPLWALFFLAGLQGIPESVIEAAKIDGAGRWQIFTRVTLPMLRGVLALCARSRYRRKLPAVCANSAPHTGRPSVVDQSDHVRDLSSRVRIRRHKCIGSNAIGYAANCLYRDRIRVLLVARALNIAAQSSTMESMRWHNRRLRVR